jgi:hypothetical protein
MLMTPTEYPMRTISDFEAVPDDRICDCLQEFVMLVLQVRAGRRKDPKIGASLRLESWTWVDDGIPLIREVSLTMGDRTEIIPNPRFPQPE